MSEKVPFMSKTGYGFIGFILLCLAFIYIDNPVSTDIVKGYVVNSYSAPARYQQSSKICRIKIGTGYTFEEPCVANAGDEIKVCKVIRKIRGPMYYANNCY